jgi:hypothetical protein
MEINLPYKVRAGLYILSTIGTPVTGYLFAKGLVGELELALWGGLVSVISLLAAFNASPSQEEV